ncbi:MAG: HD-GYP domain-containing protein [Actinomycetota bacterium]|nr:HD-GYP domain-containing protein [Actinomycetota bacterium]
MNRRVTTLGAPFLVGSLGVILYLTLVSDQPIFWFSVILLGMLIVICETLGEKMVSGGRSTYGIIALFGAIAALNTPSAMIVALLGSLHLLLIRRKDEPGNMLYSGAVYAIGTWAAAALYHALGGTSRLFTFGDGMRSIAPLLAAAAAFWVINTVFVAVALHWSKGVKPRDFLASDALRLLPNQLIYALVGLGVGVIYAQNAFHLDPLSGMIVGSTAESLRGLFAVLCLIALLGVAWYFSGKNIELLEAYDRSIEVLVTHLEKREPYLDGHAVRVAEYASMIASDMHLPFYEVNRIRHAALLHDLGRPAIPREILLRRGALSEEEFEKVKTHPLEGSTLLEEVEYLSDMAEAVRHHHEYYDGGGYIDHISADTIPLSARIIAVADAYDAMLHHRPWRDAKGPKGAAAELRQNSGRQFDPDVVEHFLSSLERSAVVEEAGAETMGRAPVEAEPRDKAEPRPRGRRTKRREEMLRARREARERIEREALQALEEPRDTEKEEMYSGGGAGDYADTTGRDPGPVEPEENPPPEDRPPDEGGERP